MPRVTKTARKPLRILLDGRAFHFVWWRMERWREACFVRAANFRRSIP